MAGAANPAQVGRNEVTWLWGRAALHEDFSMPVGQGHFHGCSISVPVAGRGWCQTWVDSDGQYLDFVGGLVDDEMILERTATRADGQLVRQRMRWWAIGAARSRGTGRTLRTARRNGSWIGGCVTPGWSPKAGNRADPAGGSPMIR